MATAKDVAASLGALITRPKLSEKYLNRPPFRFLHDIFTNVAKETGFGKGLIDASEVEGKAIEGKAAKVAFLSKWILCVGIARGAPLDTNPLKVVAGRDVEKTLVFLEALGTVAADGGNLDFNDIVRRTLAGEAPGAAAPSGGGGASSKEASPPPRARSSSRRSKESKVAEEPAASKTEAAAGPSTSTSRRSRGGGSSAVPALALGGKGSSSSPGLQSVEDADGTIPATRAALSAIIKKPKMSDQLLERPPFKFVQDIVLNVSSETKFCSRELRPWKSKISAKDKKKEFVKLVAKCVGDALGMTVDISASKLIAGKECEKTRRMLHLLAIAATKGTAGAAGASQLGPRGRGAVSGGRPSQGEPSAVRKGSSSSSSSAIAKRSADPSQPEVVRSLPSKAQKPMGVGIDEPVVGIMAEGDDDDDDDDDDDELDLGERGEDGPGGRGGAASKTGRSKFVRDQEEAARGAKEAKRRGAGSKTGEEPLGKGGRKKSGILLGRLKRSAEDGGASKTGPVDTDELMETVQKLCHSSVPLGKCMDCVQEDMEMMRREHTEWKELHATKSKEVALEQERADRDLEPLRKRIEDIDEQISSQRTLIDSQKTVVAQNEARLNRLLKSFVQGS